MGGQIRGTVQAHDSDLSVRVRTPYNHADMCAYVAFHHPGDVAALRLSRIKPLGGTPARIERVADQIGLAIIPISGKFA